MRGFRKSLSSITPRVILGLSLFLLHPFGPAQGAGEESQSVKIGVLAKRGADHCLSKWGPTADYLTAEIPGYSFKVVAVGYDEIQSTVEGEDHGRVALRDVLRQYWPWLLAALIVGASVVVSAVYVIRPNGRLRYALSQHKKELAERKRAEEALLESEQRFRNLIESSHDWVWEVDENGVYTYAGPRIREILGYEPEEVLGKTPFDFMSPEEANRAAGLFASAIVSHQPLAFLENTNLHKDGRLVVLETSGAPFFDRDGVLRGYRGMDRDITERKRAEEQLRKADRQTEMLLDSISSILIGVSRNDRITQWNAAAEKTFGIPAEQAMNKRFIECGVNWDWAPVLEQIACCRADRPTRVDNLRYTRLDGEERFLGLAVNLIIDDAGELSGFLLLGADITGRIQEEEELRKIRAALNDATDAIIITDSDGTIDYMNMAFGDLLGYTRELLNESGVESVYADKALAEKVFGDIRSRVSWNGEIKLKTREGSEISAFHRASPILDSDGGVIGMLLAFDDLTERNRLQVQLTHAQKLESIGQLAAGIAHEINTPTQYVGDNTRFLQDSFSDVVNLLDKYDQLLATAKEGPVSLSLVAEVESAADQADIGFLREEVPSAIEQSLEGVERVANIVRAMKEFSHPGGEGKNPFNINKAIESTITVARNEWKYVAEMVTDFDSELPLVPCLPGDFNQVILNLIINASHTIADAVGDASNGKGTITVSTRREGDWAEVRVSDTGKGIPEEIRDRIFDPFFTTKQVGKGTGQGLAISRSVIVDKHGGDLTFETETGRGTTFLIRLPIDSDLT